MTRQGDWGGYGTLLELAAADRKAELATEPRACPNDGTPLERNAAGELGCPFDGWVWDGITR